MSLICYLSISEADRQILCRSRPRAAKESGVRLLNAYLETELEETFALISVSEADRQTDNKQVRATELRVRLLNAYVETKLEKTYIHILYLFKEQYIF